MEKITDYEIGDVIECYKVEIKSKSLTVEVDESYKQSVYNSKNKKESSEGLKRVGGTFNPESSGSNSPLARVNAQV